MIYVFLANGFEEIEALAPVDILRRAELEVKTVGVGGKTITGSHGITVTADIEEKDVTTDDMELMILPGGMPGTLNLKATPAIQTEVLRRSDESQPIAAICAAPSILAELGVLDGRHATANPAFIKAIASGGAIVHENPVVADEFITTSRGAGTALELGIELVRQLLGDEAADEVSRGVVLTR